MAHPCASIDEPLHQDPAVSSLVAASSNTPVSIAFVGISSFNKTDLLPIPDSQPPLVAVFTSAAVPSAALFYILFQPRYHTLSHSES